MSTLGFRPAGLLWRRLVFAIAIVAGAATNAPAQDHLEPERGSVHDSLAALRYAMELQKALFKDAAYTYRARVICEPAFRPRWAVTLVCEGRDRPAYFVEYAGLEHRADGQFRAQKARAPLDREAAEAAQEVWLRMLRNVRYPEAPRSGADGVTYHFSRLVPLRSDDPHALGGWETGQIWTPDPNSRTGRLARIGEAMRDFAMASPERRDGVRERVFKEAIGLRSDLDRHPEPSGPRHPH
jgi:hypothetical protein